jgi:DNA (cytosine-5)-methyltransferase 1
VASPTFISLFAGAGGLDAGFIGAGANPIWANDIDPDAVATYRETLGNHIVRGDVGESLAEIAGLSPDLVIGGPPCQGFSVAGRMRPDDPRSKHVWTFFEAVREVQPRGFVMENVKNLAVNARWSGLVSALISYAEQLGYTTRLFLLNASHYGVPQARERMFLVGLREATPTMPAPTTGGRLPTVRNALEKLPRIGDPGNDSICTARVTPARRPVLRKSPYAGMLFNGQGRPLNLDAPAVTLPASMGGNRTPIIDQDELDGVSTENWVISYHRKLWAGHAPITCVPKRLRRLTVEEAAALQTFAPKWNFSGRQSARYRQIGNAVPPKLAEAVARQVISDLDLATHSERLATVA